MAGAADAGGGEARVRLPLREAVSELAAVVAGDDRRPAPGRDDLAAVRVARKLEIDADRVGVLFCEIGIVRKQYAWCLGVDSLERFYDIDLAFPKVADAADREGVSVSFDDDVLTLD